MKDIKTVAEFRQLESSMKEVGYSKSTIVGARCVWRKILRASGNDLPQKLVAFRQEVDNLLSKGLISLREYRTRVCQIARIKSLWRGKIEWQIKRKPNFILNDYFTSLSERIRHESLKGHVIKPQTFYASRTFFRWLQENGHVNLAHVNHDIIGDYLYERSKTSVGSGVVAVKYTLKQMFRWAYESRITTDDFGALFAFRACPYRRLFPAFTEHEINTIECGTKTDHSCNQKRNRAIILLSKSVGFRSSDIANLKLSDIDWRNGLINKTQCKTGVPITVPLMHEAGEALKEYILNERPQVRNDLVFLTTRSPGMKRNPVNASEMFYFFSRRVGLKRFKFDGKSFHAFRRTLGKNLAVAGIPLTTIAQILGHRTNDTVGKYINLDTVHLKSCALDFTGIPLSERSMFYGRA